MATRAALLTTRFRLGPVLLVISVAGAVLAYTGPSRSQESSFARVKKDVRLRKGPSVKTDVIFYLHAGEVVEVLDQSADEVKLESTTARWYKVRAFDSYEGWSFGSYLEPLTGAPLTRFPELDSTTLPALMAEKGFGPSEHFKALVIRVSGSPDSGWTCSAFDFKGTSREYNTWWPASNVKVFPAVALLQALSKQDFGPSTKLTFHYDEPLSIRLSRLITRAITHSSNKAYDLTMEAAGSTEVNQSFFTGKNGIRNAVLLRSYTHRVIIEGTDDEGSARHSPKITLRNGKRKVTLSERHDTADYSKRQCGGLDNRNRQRSADSHQGNCTSLRDLSEVVRRVMMQESLPDSEGYGISAENLELIREALAGKRARGNNIVDGLKKGFGKRRASFHHKPGYAMKWMSDVVFVRFEDTGEQYVVAMADYPGRNCLDKAARIIGELIAEGAFARQKPGSQSRHQFHDFNL